jgi:type IV pilus assembly protein PilW
MVALAVASVFLIALVSAYEVQVRNKYTQEVLTDMNQTARAALEMMVYELRTAGCDPNGVAGAGFVNAGDNTVTFTVDRGNTAGTSFQPDGLLDGPNEQIRYAINGAGNLGRDNFQGNGLQPLARNVDALDFVYLDENGAETAVLTDIRSVQVTMVARAGQVVGGFLHRHTDNTIYRNQLGEVILPAQNDSFRRLLLTTTVACRNIGLN